MLKLYDCFLAYGCPIALVPFVGKAILPLLNGFCKFVKAGLICLRLFLNPSVSLIHLSIPSPSSFDHQAIIN